MPRLWVIFLPILPNNDESIPLTILHNIGTLSSKLVLLRFNFNILKSTLTNKDIHISILDIFLKCIRPSKLCIYWLFLPCFHLCWNLEPNQSDSSAKQRSQFFVVLATASASASASTKISTLPLAIFASTICGLQYFDSNPSQCAISIKIWWKTLCPQTVHHGSLAHLCTSFWTDRRYP